MKTEIWNSWETDEKIILFHFIKIYVITLNLILVCFARERFKDKISIKMYDNKITLDTDELVNSWLRVVQIHFLKECCINHDSAINMNLNQHFIIHEEWFLMIVLMMNINQESELLTTFDELSFDLVFVWMMMKRKSIESNDVLCLMKFWNLKLDWGFA